MTKRVMCFGDSLTWGWVAVSEGSPTTRFPYHERWTGVMAAKLGSAYEIIEEGLSARTTSIDDPVDPRLNGSAYLPAAVASHLPLDLVIIMLGTNDTKSYYRRTPYEVAVGMSKLVAQVLTVRRWSRNGLSGAEGAGGGAASARGPAGSLVSGHVPGRA